MPETPHDLEVVTGASARQPQSPPWFSAPLWDASEGLSSLFEELPTSWENADHSCRSVWIPSHIQATPETQKNEQTTWDLGIETVHSCKYSWSAQQCARHYVGGEGAQDEAD